MSEKSGKYRYLAKNIGLLTLSSFATRLLSFFLLPLYTSILTTAEYGTNDLFNVTVGVLLPVLTLNIQESVLRFSMDRKTSRESIATIGVKYLLISNFIVAAGLCLNHLLRLSSLVDEYAIFFFLMFFVQSLSGIMTNYIRGIDRVADLAISSIVTSAVTIGCNILFLVVFKWGLTGYFLANFIGPFVQCIYLIVRSGFLRTIKLKKYENEEKEMLHYSKPLIVNSIAWWINNVSDRYVILYFCGLAENGIYSVAGKIPSILNVFQIIFNQVWTLSAVKDYDPEDNDGFFSDTYRAYNCLLVIVCSGIILFDKVLARFLYAKDFYVAWKYVPWLTIAILFGALSGYLGGFFSAVKDSKVFAASTVMGAAINLMLNFVLTPIYGAMGAAIATAVCYFAVWVFRYLQSKKYIKLKVNIGRDCISYILICIQAAFIIIDGTIMYVIEITAFLLLCILYAKDIRNAVYKIIGRYKA